MFLFGKKDKSKSNTFSSHKNGKKRAEVFVDYEHWYISMDKQFSMQPDIKAWRDMLAEKYDIISITFFGDFSNQALRDEIPRLRLVSSKLIDTQNPSSRFKKDFTDFIMLDSIYQRAMSAEDVDTFVIFTGDGHFNSVVSFLRTRLDKEVVIYGVKDATSSLLKNSASSFILLPSDAEIEYNCKKIIIRTVKALYEKRKNARPTFNATANAIAKEHELDRAYVEALMNSLMESGHLRQVKRYVAYRRYIKALDIDTALCISDKYI